MRCRCIRAVLIVSQLLFALHASAADLQAQDAPRVEWQAHWPKFHPIEYVTTGVLAVSSLAIQLYVDSQTSGPYGGLLFDDAVRDVLRARTPELRNASRAIADWGYRAMLVAPYLDLAISFAIHRNTEVAWQMLMLNMEAQVVAGFLGLLTNHFVARARPSTEPCATDPKYEDFCYRGAYNSFMSGHTVTAAAGAGVICAHHMSLPLYGGAGDIAVCAVSSTVALMVGVARVVNDRHWATDVVTGWLIGAAAGYVWPRLFHYRSKNALRPSYLVMPAITPESLSAKLIVWN